MRGDLGWVGPRFGADDRTDDTSEQREHSQSTVTPSCDWSDIVSSARPFKAKGEGQSHLRPSIPTFLNAASDSFLSTSLR